MHGLQAGAFSRWRSSLGVLALVLLTALVARAGMARALVSKTTTNTITQTAITSPSDPSYFYDPTGGGQDANGKALGFTVTGTTNSSSPSTDQVDIACYSAGTYQYAVVQNVSLSADGGFSVFVPYYDMEVAGIYSPDGSSCQLRAVPAGAQPPLGGGYSGPRVLLSYLTATYPYPGSSLADYSVVAPQLGATNLYTSAADCGLTGVFLNDPSIFGQPDAQSFGCADTFGADINNQLADPLQVDGVTAYTPYGPPQAYANNYYYDNGPPASISVSVSQNPANGDLTISEVEPIYVSCTSASSGYCPAGVELDRTTKQTAGGHVVEITDVFRSTDGAAHTVSLQVQNEQCFLSSQCNVQDYGNNNFNPAQVSYQFPGESSFSAHASGDTVSVGASAPASIYVENNSEPDGSTAGARGAITYFTAPSGPFSFFQYLQYGFQAPYVENLMIAPYTLTVAAGGSAQLSFAYSSEFSQSALAADIQTARDLQSAPTVTITSPAAGATVGAASVAVSGQVSAATGAGSVTVNGVKATISGSSFTATVPLTSGANTITAVLTTNSGVTASTTESVTYTPAAVAPAAKQGWAGATWLPIANTGRARHVRRLNERLSGEVNAGSAAVSYYFQYGVRGHYTHRTKMRRLAAGKRMRHLSVTISGLRTGKVYQYRIVASGKYGRATGGRRTFVATKA